MAINVNSETACRKAYLNYHCYGNSMNITAAEMGKITQAWSNRLSSWQATVANDENEYDGDDLCEQEETEVVTDYETLFNQDNKIHW
jgi:hypothetical protein